MLNRLWHMNADFEMELSSSSTAYRRPPTFESINHRLAAHLLWLTRPGDAVLLDQPASESFCLEAQRRKVEIVLLESAGEQSTRIFTPWGWTESALKIGKRVGAKVDLSTSLDTIKRVNSKLWSLALEHELGIAMTNSYAASTFAELQQHIACACPQLSDKWVIKSPFGFAARDRVLGRGPKLEGPPAVWVERRFGRNETLIFQPWLEVIREYGIVMNILPDSSVTILGISDPQANGAGTSFGYLLKRKIASERLAQLEWIASLVGERLFKEGYTGPAGVDALEHVQGFHPLLEVNARYTMGFVALAVERATAPSHPTFWSLNVS